eukprot:7266750-Karenia_brevis.AAC.1
MYSQQEKRLEISCPQPVDLNVEAEKRTPSWALNVINVVLEKQKGVVKMIGIAPPGDLERKIQ